jgi:hypothetical protein
MEKTLPKPKTPSKNPSNKTLKKQVHQKQLPRVSTQTLEHIMMYAAQCLYVS